LDDSPSCFAAITKRKLDHDSKSRATTLKA
jgi:hypothetical protein